MDPANFFWSTKRETVRLPRLVESDLSLWQARQSSVVGPGAVVAAAPVESSKAITKTRPQRFTGTPRFGPRDALPGNIQRWLTSGEETMRGLTGGRDRGHTTVCCMNLDVRKATPNEGFLAGYIRHGRDESESVAQRERRVIGVKIAGSGRPHE